MEARTRTYELYDEVKAPETIGSVNVQVGDRGVVVDILNHPQAAVVVEYADSDGQTKALVFYKPDLTEVVDVQTL